MRLWPSLFWVIKPMPQHVTFASGGMSIQRVGVDRLSGGIVPGVDHLECVQVVTRLLQRTTARRDVGALVVQAPLSTMFVVTVDKMGLLMIPQIAVASGF